MWLWEDNDDDVDNAAAVVSVVMVVVIMVMKSVKRMVLLLKWWKEKDNDGDVVDKDGVFKMMVVWCGPNMAVIGIHNDVVDDVLTVTMMLQG